jgi:hypothetical protein
MIIMAVITRDDQDRATLDAEIRQAIARDDTSPIFPDAPLLTDSLPAHQRFVSANGSATI